MEDQNEATSERLAYHTPELRDHGTIAELTLAIGEGGDYDGSGYDGPAAGGSL